MARIGQLFGGRTAADRDGDGVDDRVETDRAVTDRTDTDRTETRTWRLGRRHDKDGDGVDDRAETTRTQHTGTIPAVGTVPPARTVPPVADRDSDATTVRRSIDRERPAAPVSPPAAGTQPVTEPVPVRQAPARVSLLATLGLMLGLAGVAVALTGVLAPWAIAIGALGLLFSFGGIIAGVRPHVAGRGLGTLGVLLSATAVVFGILALTGQVSWLDSDVNQVARLNEWLDAKVPWMKDW